MPENVTLVRDGNTITVPLDQAGTLLADGYAPQTGEQGADRAASAAKQDIYGGIGGKIVAGAAGLARGGTLGLSDIGLDALGLGRDLKNLRDVNPYTSLATEIVGGVAPALVPGLGVTPAGQLAKLGSKVTALGEGAGVVGRTAAAAAGGALEGGVQNAGAYLSQTALENKPISAEGFWGAVGSGALVGGGIAGGLSLGEQALVKAKTLFPRTEVTREAAQEAERQVSTELTQATADGDDLLRNAKAELQKNRLIVSTSDAETAQRVNALKVQRAEEELRQAQLKTAKLTAPKEPKKPRKAFEEPAVPVETPAVTPEAPAAASDDLLTQLQGTKQALDDGQTLAQVSKRSLDDEVDDVVAAVDPNHAKLLDATRELDQAKSKLDAWMSKYNQGGKGGKGEVAAFERNQAGRDWAGKLRKKDSYIDTLPMDAQTPGMAEGSLAVPRGRTSVWRGSEEARAVEDARIMSKLAPEERVAADMAVEDQMRRWAMSKRLGMSKPAQIAEEVVNAAPQVVQQVDQPIETKIAAALREHVGEHVDATENIADAVQVIGRYEQASAKVADILGPAAPPAAQARAAQLRTTTDGQLEGGAQAVADLAKDLDKKLPADIATPAPAPATAAGSKLSPATPSNVGAATAVDAGGALKKAADIGTVLEVMSSLGIPGVPELKSLPVVGPLLSLYLKARAASAVYRRLGGKVPANVETTIAKNAAKTQDRVVKAVDRILDAGATGARKARILAGPMTALQTKLFDNPAPSNDRKPAKKGGDVYRDYNARIAELARAAQPGAIADAVRKRVPTADPMLQAELVAAAERKLAFLDSKAPKLMKLPTLLKGDGDWKPSKLQLAQFARYIEAAEDPAGVLEKLGDTGQVTYEAAETLRVVYPKLYQTAQMRLMERAPELQQKLPYSRRVALSILFSVPVDGTMDSDYVNFLRAGQPANNSAAPAQGSPAAPPTPTAAGPVMLGDRSMTRLDRRAGA